MNFIYPAIIATAFFIYYDATKNNIGKIPGEQRFTNLSAGMWAFGALMLWIIVLPLYVFNRSKLIAKVRQNPQPVTGAGKIVKLSMLGVLFLVSLGGAILNSPLLGSAITGGDIPSQITGIWRGSDGTMIAVDLVSPKKSIKVNEDIVPVTIASVDNVNLIVTINATIHDEKMIWTLRQNFATDKTFTLIMTLQEGTRDELSFVRNI